jgi:hypothetical protein
MLFWLIDPLSVSPFLLHSCLINRAKRITSQNDSNQKNYSNLTGRWYCHLKPCQPFVRSLVSSPTSPMKSWLITLLRTITAFHIIHLSSLEKHGYMSYLLGIQNACGRNLVYTGVHSSSLSKPFKVLVFSHYAMFLLKSNSWSFSISWSQCYLALMLESVFSDQQT